LLLKFWDHLFRVILMQTVNHVPQEVVQQVSEYFSILSEPMRLRILNLLREGEKCVQELVEATATSQANVSKHLKVMLQAGILSRRSEGTSAYYKVEDELIFELCNLVCDRLATRIEQQARHFRDFSLANKD
jgi:DNA-binding transcriptional ArsR family regulator